MCRIDVGRGRSSKLPVALCELAALLRWEGAKLYEMLPVALVNWQQTIGAASCPGELTAENRAASYPCELAADISRMCQA